MTRYIAVDVETSSLKARFDSNEKIYCIGFAWYENYVEMHSAFQTWEDGRASLLQLVADPSTTFIIHNASFDIAVLRTHGVDIPSGRYLDSMLLAYCANPGSDVSLETLAEPLGYPKQDIHLVLKEHGVLDEKSKKSDVWTYDYSRDAKALDLLGTYCAKDCEAALSVFSHVWETHYLHDDKLRKNYLELELPYVECIIDMERTGMFIDQAALGKLKRNLERRLAALDVQLKRRVPYVPDIEFDSKTKTYIARASTYSKGYYKNSKTVPSAFYTYDDKLHASEPNIVYDHCKLIPFNMNASRHLCWQLMKEGWVPEEYSKKSDEPVTDKEVMEELQDKYPIARLYAAHNTYSKLLGTFVEGIENAIDSKGYAHGSFNQCITKTTRLSSSSPNLQNLPARSSLGLKVREAVIAPDGYTLAVADLDQVELRILAYYLEKVMGDSTMAVGAREKLDAHQVNADAWGVPRKMAKGGIFAINYGAQAPKLALSLKVKVDAAQELIDNISSKMPSIQGLKEKVWRNLASTRPGLKLVDEEGRVRSDGVIYTLFGSRIFYPKHNHRWEGYRHKAQRQSFNALIQGTGANINKELSLRIMPVLKKYGCKMVFTCHDEVGVYIPNKYVNVVLSKLNEIYDCWDILPTQKGGVPVTGTWQTGKNWKTAKG